MPHLIIEFSANACTTNDGPVDVDDLVDALHDAALATGIAPLDGLRTRSVGLNHFAIADRHPDNAFIAVTARLGAGRSDEDKQRFVESLMNALERFLGGARETMMLSVEYQEIDPANRINRNYVRPLVEERRNQEGSR
jgi:5-carboxymethyl-2-hydroxymuconate isomerase